MSELVKVYKADASGQNKAEVKNAKAAGMLFNLFATAPTSEAAYTAASDESLVKVVTTGNGKYIVEVTHDKAEEQDGDYLLTIDKSNVKKYIESVLAIGKAKNNALSFVEVVGNRGKRGRTAEALDLSEL